MLTIFNFFSNRSEIFTQNRLRAALQKKSTTGVSQNYFSKKKFKNSFSDDFRVFLTTFLPYLLNHLSYRSEFFFTVSAIGVSKNYFPKKKIKKNSFLDNFRVFLTPFVPYLINHLSYRSEIFTQNRLRAALQKSQLQESPKIIFQKKKLKNSFSDDFRDF